jgi:polar amino acid transport system substrate-binding protein
MLRHTVFLCIATALLLLSQTVEAQNGPGANTNLTLLTEEVPPLNFTEDGVPTGLTVDVVHALMHRLGSKAAIKMLPWEKGYATVLRQPDTALFTTVMTAERKGLLQWVGPVTALDTNFYAVKGSGITIKTLGDAKHVAGIATVGDYSSQLTLKAEGFSNLQSYPNEQAAVRSLLDGKSQLFVGINVAMPALLRKAGISQSGLEKVFTLSTDLAYIAFSRDTPTDLVARWQAELDGMKRDGSFDAIYAKWLPGETPPGILQMVTEEYPPITFMKDGRPSGFVTDMVRAIASRLHARDDIRLTSWKNAYHMALLNPNVILFSAERTPQREDLFHWVGPVGRNSAIFYAKKGAHIRLSSLADAKRLPAIATTTDWFTEQYLKREGFTNLVSAKEPTENLRQLMDGKVQLSIFTDLTIPEIAKNAGYSMADLEPVYTVSQTDFYIAISKGTPVAVVRAWQAVLDDLKADGSFEKIYRSYLPHAQLKGLLRSQPR